jgi:hypothetical protein
MRASPRGVAGSGSRERATARADRLSGLLAEEQGLRIRSAGDWYVRFWPVLPATSLPVRPLSHALRAFHTRVAARSGLNGRHRCIEARSHRTTYIHKSTSDKLSRPLRRDPTLFCGRPYP